MMLAFVLAASLAIGTPVAVDAALLADLPVAEASFTAHGQTQRCEGPLLRDLVVKLGAPSGHDLSGPALTRGVVVRARDGYAVLFSLGELDAALGTSDAILALRCDGKPLGDEIGPVRLVAPGEQRAARSARQVATIELVDPAPARK